MFNFFWRKHPIAGIFWRFFTGQPVLGTRKTDATFFFKGQKKNNQYVKVTRLAFMPGYQVLVLRWIIVTIVIVLGYFYVFHRSTFFHIMWITLCITITSVIGGTYWFYGRWKHNKLVVRPVIKVIAPYAEIAPNPSRPGKVLSIPRNYWSNENTVIRLTLDPDTWTADETRKKYIHEIITNRLGKEWTPKWNDHKTTPNVEWTRTQYPPDSVSFKQLLPWIENNPDDGKVIIGQGVGKTPIVIDLVNDSPHIALSVGTGGGKSSILRIIILQFIRHHLDIVILDVKRISQNCFKTVPCVTILRDMEECMHAMHRFRVEMEDRYKQLDNNETLQFPRKLLVIEELNSLMMLMIAWWKTQSAEDKRLPKRCPAIDDFIYILVQGRAANMHMIVVAQRLEAAISGGGTGRGQFGTILLARFKPADWKMLVDTYPRPPSSRHPGRAVIVTDGHESVQIGFIGTDDAREYALRDHPRIITPDLPVEPIIIDPPEPRFSMKQIIEREFIPMKYSALVKARQRDPEFPKGVDDRYTRSEIVSWFNNRTRAPIVRATNP